MVLKNNTSWDEQAKWYDKIVGEEGSYYHKEVIVPNLLKKLGEIKNKKILDLGCGQGFFCRILAKYHAQVVGIDLSKKLIELAKKYQQNQIQYYVANSENLSFLDSNSFDFVISILSVNNIKNITKTFGEVYKILKRKGKFIFVTIHPCFRIPRQTHWGYDENQKIQYRRIDRYLSEMEIPIITHPGKIRTKNPNLLKDQDYSLMFHRPLQNLFKEITKNQFLVSDLEEWCSNKISIGKRAKTENRARKEIPLFLMLEAIKLE
ncbi:MAG: class I SAM-dependent methyltransferase [Leptonema sp. (in: bacteria)]